MLDFRVKSCVYGTRVFCCVYQNTSYGAWGGGLDTEGCVSPSVKRHFDRSHDTITPLSGICHRVRGEEGMNHDWFWVRATYLVFFWFRVKVDPRTVCTVQYVLESVEMMIIVTHLSYARMFGGKSKSFRGSWRLRVRSCLTVDDQASIRERSGMT